MDLWRVDVAGVSHRFVEAESSAEAVDKVTESLLAALDLRATRAGGAIARLHRACGPVQRRRLLASVDGLTPPAGLREARQARRRLARQIRYDRSVRAWAAGVSLTTRPVDPEVLATLLRQLELAHVRSVKERLRRLEKDLDNDY